jgi:hypothetical protein
MRKLVVLILVALGVLLVASAAPALASARTFYVHPSGGGDTAAIQAAFNAAVKAGPGSTVQLSAGTFYTNNIVVQNFKGYFRGAGQGRTLIDCLRGLDPSLPGATEAGNPGYWLSLFLFRGGNLSVSDMSFDITASSPAEQWNNAGTPADYLGTMVQVCGNASSSFSRVGFMAGSGNDSGFNADEGLLMSGIAPIDANDNPITFAATTGVDSVYGCSFSGHDGMQVNGLTAGRLTVSGNVFDESIQCCLVDDAAVGPRPTSSSPTTTSSPAATRPACRWRTTRLSTVLLTASMPPSPTTPSTSTTAAMTAASTGSTREASASCRIASGVPGSPVST